MKKYQYLIGKIKKSQSGQRLDKILTELFYKYSRSQVKNWIINNLVKINKKLINIPKKKCLVMKLLK